MSSFTLHVVDGTVFLGNSVKSHDAELFQLGELGNGREVPTYTTLEHDLADHNSKHIRDPSQVTVEEELQAIGGWVARTPEAFAEQAQGYGIGDICSYAVYQGRPLKSIPHTYKRKVRKLLSKVIPLRAVREAFSDLDSACGAGISMFEHMSRKEYIRTAMDHVVLGYLYTWQKCKNSYDPVDRYQFIHQMAMECLAHLRQSGARKLVCHYDTARHLYTYNTYGEAY